MLSNLRYKAALAYWRIFRPITIGVKALLVSNDRILLVKQSYQDYWSLPGGGVEANESVFSSVSRELREETGIEVAPSEFSLKSIHFSSREGKSDHVALLAAQIDRLPSPVVNSELSAAEWFSISALPRETSPATKRRIDEYISNSESDIKW